MDLLLGLVDPYIDHYLLGGATAVAAGKMSSSSWYAFMYDRESILRQAVVIQSISTIGGYLLYFIVASLSYLLLFKQINNLGHKPLPGQVATEIKTCCTSIPIMGLLLLPVFLLEARGYSRLYDRADEYGWPYLVFSVVWFFVFTDTLIYWIHRTLHHRSIYKYIHKLHHHFQSPTPYAAYAFHPVDGVLQSLPYKIFIFLFPFQKVLSLVLFILVNIWTIAIHDGVTANPPWWLNGSAHHSFHHSQFVGNYGQYFVFWDYLMGTLTDPKKPVGSQASKASKSS